MLNGDFADGEFLAPQRGAAPTPTPRSAFVPYVPVLQEGVNVEATVINGIASQSFLAGDGMARFTGEFRSAVSAYESQLGWYKVAADGTIGNVRLLVSDTRDAEAIGRSFDLGAPANDERIGFFLITNGVWAYGNNLPDDLSLRAAWRPSGERRLLAGAAADVAPRSASSRRCRSSTPSPASIPRPRCRSFPVCRAAANF